MYGFMFSIFYYNVKTKGLDSAHSNLLHLSYHLTLIQKQFLRLSESITVQDCPPYILYVVSIYCTVTDAIQTFTFSLSLF